MLQQQLFPVWMNSGLNDRFHEQEKIRPLNQKLSELEDQLKDELTLSLFQAILNWGELMNQRNSLEKE